MKPIFFALFLSLLVSGEGEAAVEVAEFLVPGHPGRERRPETSDGFRRRFGLGFEESGKTRPLRSLDSRQCGGSDMEFAGAHVGVFPFAKVFKRFLQ
ncbi:MULTISPECIES: hypothetical protein [unclassified Neorhizobium]|uniref:hypothetical protein n=1 Tax=unclassified Neorhizobium TaxID=2629175 RepID=UPI001FF4E35F|nr:MULTISPECIES: hypothetical protein [unclassified Neorhizobium]MCJ9669148.1 hypothetical protein [Neorhizobium sp. SHOUNA12B]MCJ9744416.1 hypothetical protein [Neorhizobium sp. SHOUNA12A]